MGRVAKLLGTLAAAGTVTAGAAVYASQDVGHELQSCYDVFGVQEPQLSLSDRIWAWGDPKYGEVKKWEMKVSAALEKIRNIGSEPDNVSKLSTCARAGDSRIREESAAALGRIGTLPAKRALYALITATGRSETENDAAVFAASQLRKIEPSMAAAAIIKRKGKPEKDYRSPFGSLGALMGVEFYDDLTDILIGTGNIATLKYFMQNKMADELVSFVNRNDPPFLKTYSWAILGIINDRMYPPGVSLACMGADELINYGNAIRKLNRSYAEGAATSEFERNARYCRYTWRGNFPEHVFLGALRGK